MPTLKADGTRRNGSGSKWIRPARRRAIYQRDGWVCFWCAVDLRNAPPAQRTLDHLVPRARGGGHESTNLVTACKPCNDRRQHARVPVRVVRLVRSNLLTAHARARVENSGGGK